MVRRGTCCRGAELIGMRSVRELHGLRYDPQAQSLTA